MVCLAHAFFIWPWSVQVGYDEGFEAAAVERIISGQWLPYVDGFAHRGPFLYWTQAIFHVLSGRFEWTGTRLLALCCALTTTSTTYLAGWAAGWPVAGAIGALTNVFITCAVLSPGGGIGVHGEPVAIAYLTLGLFVTAYALHREPHRRRRLILIAVGGALTAICALTKQTLALTSIPLFLWVLVHQGSLPPPSDGSEPRWRRILGHGAVVFAAGGFGLLLLVLLRYAVVGELGTFFYWSTGFNANSYLAPYKGKMLKIAGGWFWGNAWAMAGTVLALLVLARPLAFVEKRSLRGLLDALRSAAFELAVASTALALLVAAAFPMRFWEHYFFPIYPFFGLVFGIIVESLVRRGTHVTRAAQAGVLLVACVMAVTHPTQRLIHLHKQRASGSWDSHRPDPACIEIDRLAGAGRDPIFIWGMVGDLYITCQRPSASLFTYTTVLAGVIPPFWSPDPSRVTPGSRETLLRELTETRPAVIIDCPISRKAGMVDIPVFKEFLNANYCSVSVVKDKRDRDLTFYARADLPGCTQKPITPKKKKKNEK